MYIVRHGTTKLNEQNRFRGPLDVPLDEKGKRQADAVGKLLASKPIGTIFHSDRKRASETAKRIESFQRSDHKMVVLPRLRAWDLGEFAGKEKNAENTRAVDEFVRNPNKRVPGGESLNEFRKRVRPVFDAAESAAKRASAPPVFVAHSSIIHEIGQMYNGSHQSALVEPGGIVAIVQTSTGRPKVKVLFRPVAKPGDHSPAS